MFDLYNANNLEILKQLPDNSIDSVVSDPPYGWSFMGKNWDYDVPSVETWTEVMRVLKPGGHMLIACGTRTQHRMAVNIEDAGFEIRDIVAWVYGSGFPKSLNIGKAVDKLQGNEREVVKEYEVPDITGDAYGTMNVKQGGSYKNKLHQETKGNSPYEGWGTALKPAMELWTLARKPLSEKTVAENVLKWGTGGINIDGCRVELNGEDTSRPILQTQSWCNSSKIGVGSVSDDWSKGRFPANFIHDGSEEVVEMFPKTKSGGGNRNSKGKTELFNGFGDTGIERPFPANEGSASRFFYCAKASKNERNKGLDGFEEKTFGFSGGANGAIDRNEDYNEGQGIGLNRVQKMKNHHPTVKPVSLMKYLCRLITPTNGTVLDLYMGSGSTGIACKDEGFNFVGIELDKDYFEIAKARINNWTKQ